MSKAYPTSQKAIADMQASKTVCRRMFIVFLERMAPAQSCMGRGGRESSQQLDPTSRSVLEHLKTHHSETSVHNEHKSTGPDQVLNVQSRDSIAQLCGKLLLSSKLVTERCCQVCLAQCPGQGGQLNLSTHCALHSTEAGSAQTSFPCRADKCYDRTKALQ